MVRLHLTVLGGFQGRLDSGLALTLPTRKSQALVAYLALPLGRSHPRDKLAALLWGDLAQPQARGGLRQALSRLRRTVATEPPAVLLDGDHVALNPAVVDVDAFEFERLIEQGTPDALERACALYGGDLLQGFALSEPAFEEWLLAERERLRELALEALARLLRHHCTAGSREAALPTALRLVALDPLQESVHRALMRLYVEVGRRPAALRQYQICVGALHRELGVEPEAATKQLYQDILRQRPARLTTDAEGAGASGQPDTPRHTDESALSRELPLVGREAETLRLREALDDAWTGRGGTVAVVGEAGVGKSRLVAEIAAEAFARQGRVLVGRCYEAEQILPFGPWVDALRAARLDATDPALESLTLSCRAELARLLPELRRPGQEAAPGPAEYRQLFESVAQLLRRLALPQPLMIVIEDLHWADEISLRLLSFLGRRIAGGPILLVATARDEDLAGAPMLRRTLEDLGPNLVQMPLLPLSKAETLALVRVLARRGSHETAVTGLADQIWRVSEGNPFVVVETVRALPEETRPEPVATVTVPRRVREVIVRHHEGLSARGRELTALAAAIGREFDFLLLSRSAGLDEGEAAATVEELVRRRVLHNVGEQFDFTHDRIREVVYQSLLRERQRTLHARIAGTIEQLYADRLDDHVERLADHTARGALHDKAVVYLRQAGAKAFSNSAHAEALGYFMHALEVLEKLAPGVDRDREELALRLALGPTLQVTRGHAAPEVEENYRRTRELSGRVGPPVQQFQALWGLWLASSYRASSTTALQLGRELLALAEGSGDAALLLEGHHALWPVLVWLGHLKEARRHAELGMALYDKTEHRSHAFVYGGHDPGMCCAKYASWALWLLGYPARALEYSVASLRLAEELAHPPSTVLARVWACIFHDLRREVLMVQQHAGSLIAVATLPSTPQWRAAGTIIDGWVRAELGAEETAVAQIREGLDIYASTGAALFMPYFLSLLARAYARIRQSDAGLPVIGQALEKARTTGELVWEPELLRLEGEMRLTSRPADVEGAQQCFRQAIALARQQDARSWELRSALSLARSLVAAGQPDQARRTLGDVYGWFTEGFDTPDLEDARMLLDSRLPRPENQHV